MSKGKVLILASVASMIDQFNMSNICILLSMDYEVHVACNFEKGNTCNQEKIDKLKNRLSELNVKYYQIDFTRSVFKIFEDIKAYKQVKKILKENNYKFVHCHSPIGGAIGRLVCRSTNTKCIYTAHGFHFFKGAPLKNWMIFYPIEKWLSKYTDVLITINKEDYNRAKNKFKMKQLEYVPGVGIDTKKYHLAEFDRNNYRRRLGYSDDDFVILSVGELNKNKNHEVVLKALSKLDNPNIKYMIAGQGELEEYLLNIAMELKIDNNFQLLGFRNDIPELLNSSDLFILPSIREGLNVSLMEAMSADLAISCSKIRGNVDLIKDKQNGFIFDCDNIIQIVDVIERTMSLSKESKKSIIEYNKRIKENFSLSNVNEQSKKIYYQINCEEK